MTEDFSLLFLWSMYYFRLQNQQYDPICFNTRKNIVKGVKLEAVNTNSSDVYVAWAMTHSFKKEVKIFKSLYLFFQDEKHASASCDSSPPLQTVVMSPM